MAEQDRQLVVFHPPPPLTPSRTPTPTPSPTPAPPWPPLSATKTRGPARFMYLWPIVSCPIPFGLQSGPAAGATSCYFIARRLRLRDATRERSSSSHLLSEFNLNAKLVGPIVVRRLLSWASLGPRRSPTANRWRRGSGVTKCPSQRVPTFAARPLPRVACQLIIMEPADHYWRPADHLAARRRRRPVAQAPGRGRRPDWIVAREPQVGIIWARNYPAVVVVVGKSRPRSAT